MRRIKSFFGNQTFFGKNYKIFVIISSKSGIWQKMHVPCKNILDGQSLTAPCGRHRHKPASARRQRPARSRPPGRQSGQSRCPRPALRRPAGPQRPRGRQSAQARDSAKCAPGRRGSARAGASCSAACRCSRARAPLPCRPPCGPPAPCNNGPHKRTLWGRAHGRSARRDSPCCTVGTACCRCARRRG